MANNTRAILKYLADEAHREFAYVPGRQWLFRDVDGNIDFNSIIAHWRPDRAALALREAIIHWLGKKAESEGGAEWDTSQSTVALARELEPFLVQHPEAFDTDRDVAGLACDQLVELRTGTTRTARADDRISMWLSVSALGDEPQCWLEALARALPSEYERAWFQRWCGYCLTGHTREHKFLFLQGPAGGGKSTIVDILRTVVSGCVKARINGEQRIPLPAVCGAGDDSERWVGV